MSGIRIVEERGSHLLVERAGRFAVVERRGGRVYGIEGGARPGEPDTPAGIAAAVGARGWGDEAGARRRFREAVERGDTLARRIW